jgi:hypothetical protein
MKIDFKKIINIKNKENLNNFISNKPIFQKNYLFHYLIELNNLDGLKLKKWPIYIENNDGLNGFHIASRVVSDLQILEYLIENYPEYIYNRNLKRETFANYLPIDQFTQLIKKYPKLDWDDLIINSSVNKNELFKSIILNLSYNKLLKFLQVYKIKPTDTNNYLHGIVKSNLLSSDEKIKILDEYSEQDLNIKPINDGTGLIIIALDNNDEKIVDYLLNRNIDLNYYTFVKTNSPLTLALYYDIMNNNNLFSRKIFDKLKIIDPEFLTTFNNNLNNITHSCLILRQNRNQLMDMTTKINYTELEILKYYDSSLWNQLNIDKVTPLELLVELDYNIYSNIIIDNKIAINPEIISKLKENYVSSKKWLNLFEKQPVYNEPKDEIIIDDSKYSHYTLFQSKFKDIGIFTLYLNDKYKELLIPNTQIYMINNLTFENTFPFSDDLIAKESVFPWIISYYSNTEYYIHPYLNNLINAERHNKDKRFGIVFLSLTYDQVLHANVLIYDFKNLTIERFEPYGNTSLIENEVDDLLEEELTWSTGLKYLRPKDFLPFAGFQTISDETNLINTKAGDFGGFCLAWCIWYIETRIKNPNIDPKTLVLKIINKLNKMEYKFSEHIRNYSNKINEQRIKYIKKIGIDEKDISNLYLTNDNDSVLTKYLIKKYNGTINPS